MKIIIHVINNKLSFKNLILAIIEKKLLAEYDEKYKNCTLLTTVKKQVKKFELESDDKKKQIESGETISTKKKGKGHISAIKLKGSLEQVYLT